MSNPRNKWLIAGGVSASLLASLTLWENNASKPYDDIAMVLSVCRGHTGSDIIRGKTYTKQECDDLTAKDLKIFYDGVYRCVNVPISQKTWDSFVLTAYNIGVTGFCNSSALKKFNAGDKVGGCDFMAWNKSTINGKLTEVRGLTNRRRYEMKLCLEGL
jgi:lysozyme